MISVIQRVSRASIEVLDKQISAIGQGYLILLGIGMDDAKEDVEYLSSKISKLRLFNDEHGKINRSIIDIEGDIILVSQFTLQASTKKGNRPSFINAAKPNKARDLYLEMVDSLGQKLSRKIFTGEFGADMKVALVNDGPVTIILDSRDRV